MYQVLKSTDICTLHACFRGDLLKVVGKALSGNVLHNQLTLTLS